MAFCDVASDIWQPLHAGALYTAHVRPDKPSPEWVGPFAIDVQVPAG